MIGLIRIARCRLPLRCLVAAFVLLALVAGCGGSAQTTDRASATPAPSDVRVISTTNLSPRMRDLTIWSPAVGQTVKVRVLLPSDFGSVRGTLPVIFLLHGCCDDYRSWTRSTDVAALSQHTEVLIVMPDGGRAGFYSNWLTGPQWENFHLVELPRVLARDYHASGRWAVAGNSMGGLGALGYAARHSEMFEAAASFSGIVNTRLNPDESNGYQKLVSSEGADPSALWGDPVKNVQIWRAHNPFDLAPRLRGTRLYVSAGSGRISPGDNPGAAGVETSLRAENDAFATHLKALGIPATVHLYDPGVHDWPYWQRELHRAWPMLSSAVGQPPR